MTKEELASELREIQHADIEEMTDDYVIDCFLTCPDCGEKQVDEEDLRSAIKAAEHADHFFDICEGMANVHYERELKAKKTCKPKKKIAPKEFPKLNNGNQ